MTGSQRRRGERSLPDSQRGGQPRVQRSRPSADFCRGSYLVNLGVNFDMFCISWRGHGGGPADDGRCQPGLEMRNAIPHSRHGSTTCDKVTQCAWVWLPPFQMHQVHATGTRLRCEEGAEGMHSCALTCK